MSQAKEDRRFELISTADDLGEVTQTEASSLRKRKAIRIDVESSDPPVQIGGPGGKLMKVKTLSENGAAVFHGDCNPGLQTGRCSQLFLDVGSFRIPLMSKLLYSAKDWVALKFIQTSSAASISLRQQFELEFIAASLRSHFETSSFNGVLHRRITYGQAEGNRAQFVVAGNELKSFEIDCGQSGFYAKWEAGIPILLYSEIKEKPTEKQLRAQIISFMRNLEAMNPSLLKTLEKISKTSKIKIDQVR